MPIKHTVRERAWGTRYDTLKSSPSSPSTQPSPAATISDTHSTTSIQTSPSVIDDTKAQDDPPSPSVAPKTDRPNHDSSIFVGSLPTHIDLPELNHLLFAHFAIYPQVKDVKAIRDNNKGSVCAFVQCEDAEAASQLLKTLQESQNRPFQGRFLRFEFARASRTLVVTYRTPPQYAYPNSGFDGAVESDALRLNVDGELPSAMRLFRPRNSKYPTVLYDSEALAFDAKITAAAMSPEIVNAPASDDRLSGAGVLIHPLEYDSETLRHVMLAFGPIEHFGLFTQAKDDAEEDSKASKIFGDVPRAPCMDSRIWEIKWERREDCMNASMTLRRIPHLVVSWAHHLGNEVGPDSRFGSPSASPGPLYPSMSRMRNTSRPRIGGEHQRFGDHGQFSPVFMPSSGNLRLAMSSPFSDGSRSPSFKNWSPICSSPNTRGPTSPLATRGSSDALSPDTTLTPDLNEVDFPPLHTGEVLPQTHKAVKPLALPWVQRGVTSEDTASVDAVLTSPSSSLSVQPSTPHANNEDKPATHPPDSPTVETGDSERVQEITVPPTPEAMTSTVTPITPKSVKSYPLTPQSAVGGSRAGGSPHSPDAYHTTPRRAGRFASGPMDEGDRDREVDPTSLFVGNLEIGGPHPWTEERLKGVFERHGTIEDLKLYEPAQKIVAFAFIRYSDTESCARAIAVEHQRLYDGRPIRVQFRELKPHSQRTPFKVIRGRGRSRVFDDSPHRHYGNGDYHAGHFNDDFASGTSPRAMHGRPMSYCDPRYPTIRQLPESQHFAGKQDAAETAGQATFNSVHTTERKVPPIHEESNGAAPWRQSIHPQDLHQERSISAGGGTSASISPPPSSTSSHPPSVMGAMHPYPMMMPWMHPYHPYAYPMPYVPAYMGYPHPAFASYPAVHDPNGTNGDANSAQPPPWVASAHTYKKSAGHTSDDQNASQTYPQNTPQPPLRPVGFEQSAGALVPMYPPEALNQYMSAHGHGQAQDRTITPSQSGSASQQPQQQAVPGWQQYTLPAAQMPMYPYPYSAHMHPAASQIPSVAGQYSNGWATSSMATGYPSQPSAQPQAPAPGQTQAQATRSPYVTPSSSAGLLNASASFGQYGVGHTNNEQSYNYRSYMPPRRGVNRAYGSPNNRGARGSPNRFGRLGANGSVEASYSFVDTIPQSRSHQHAAMRASGSYPASFPMSSSTSGM